jgi:very-short-patch-repair endonuclease
MNPRRRDMLVHRSETLGTHDVAECEGIPVTTPICTLLDLAAHLSRRRVERAIDEADRLDLVDPETLRRSLEEVGRRPGARALRETLDRRTFVLTESDLERRFLPLADRAGLGLPQTRQIVCGFRVDFYWSDLRLVVETDGLRRLRDQALAAAGITCLRFTHAQIAFEPDHVVATLAVVAERLRGSPLG